MAEQDRWAVRPTATGLALLGAALLVFWYLTNSGSLSSTAIFLAGVTLLSSAILLYFLSPARYLRSEVSDAEALGNTLNVGRFLTAMLVQGHGIYLPASRTGGLKVFIPVADGQPVPFQALQPGCVFIAPPDSTARGILLEPPGCGLVRHAGRIGVRFSGSGLEGELRDVMVKGMELATGVEVTGGRDEVQVRLIGLASRGLCESVRKEQPGLCTQIGCPVCSFIACAIVEGTGRAVRIKSASVDGKALVVTFQLQAEA